MKFRFFICSVFALLFTSPLPSFAKEPLRVFENCIPSKVSDGDTITALCDGSKLKIRLYGIDAPETEKANQKTGKINKLGQPYGDEARQALIRKITGKMIKVDVLALDQYKRAVSLLYLEGRNINREMVSEGWSWAFREYLHHPYKSEFIDAEEEARSRRLGLWKDGNPEPPWEFRKRSRIR